MIRCGGPDQPWPNISLMSNRTKWHIAPAAAKKIIEERYAILLPFSTYLCETIRCVQRRPNLFLAFIHFLYIFGLVTVYLAAE